MWSSRPTTFKDDLPDKDVMTNILILILHSHSYCVPPDKDVLISMLIFQLSKYQTWQSLRWMSRLVNLFWHSTADDHSGEFTDQSTQLQGLYSWLILALSICLCIWRCHMYWSQPKLWRCHMYWSQPKLWRCHMYWSQPKLWRCHMYWSQPKLWSLMALHIFEARCFHALPSVVHPFSQNWSNYCYDYY